MGTRSDIIVHRGDGSWKRVYCHWDGYLEGVGATLLAHYATQERADALVEPGDMSSLYERCDGAPGHSFDKPVDGQTVYYGRDRGEKDATGKIGATLMDVWPPKDTWTEYAYVFDGGVWSWCDSPGERCDLAPLAPAVAAIPARRSKLGSVKAG